MCRRAHSCSQTFNSIVITLTFILVNGVSGLLPDQGETPVVSLICHPSSNSHVSNSLSQVAKSELPSNFPGKILAPLILSFVSFNPTAATRFVTNTRQSHNTRFGQSCLFYYFLVFLWACFARVVYIYIIIYISNPKVRSLSADCTLTLST